MANYAWILLSALLVFVMQAGFLCLESGRVRSKNSINVAAKNISDFAVSSTLFWLFGFGIMFGDSHWGLFGGSSFAFGADKSAYEISFFLFQMMFCGTATTLVAGAVAERMGFSGYLCLAVVTSALIYPIAGHWAWAGLGDSSSQGWLEQLGFIDFAGSTIVHSVGGWVALAAIIILGPRKGRFDSGADLPPGSNLPVAALGVILIWLGWFGFNGGSALAFSERVPLIILNTSLAAAWGAIAATLLSYIRLSYFEVRQVLNGIIAGLVGITASCHLVSPGQAALIGIVAGAIGFFGSYWLIALKIDDAIDVVPTHLFAGIWGTLAVPLFVSQEDLANGLTSLEQLGTQLLGIVAIGTYSFLVSFSLILLLKRFVRLRVSEHDEDIGLNVSEHRASTELIDLLSSMKIQQSSRDYSKSVPEEPFTEVGQIAKQYNQVIRRVGDEMAAKDTAIASFQSSESRKTAILNSAMDSIISIDTDGTIIEFNPASERTFGCTKNQTCGSNFIDSFVLPKDRKRVHSDLALGFSESPGLLLGQRNQINLQRSSGHRFPAELTITVARVNNIKFNEFTLHIRDITKAKKLQDKLRFLAYSDPVTSLYNRTYLMEKLSFALSQAKKNQATLALLFLDLDRFKKINDTLGHKAGDELLREVANRLTSVTRDTDIIARWGGDEFVILLSGQINESVACRKANDVLVVMRQPININDSMVNIPTSIGVALSVDGRPDADRLIQQADMAMYAAKEHGRDNFQLFSQEMASNAEKFFSYERDLRQSISTSQLYLQYQPKVQGSREKLIGIEALIRWEHPEKGNISPADFIPMAEDSNLIIAIGEKVISEALAQLANWRAENRELLRMAINISGKHLLSDELIPFLKKELQRHGIPGSYLEIEITEGVLIKDIEKTIEVFSQLKELDIKIAVDDFGTGYSSLNYLKRLPIDILKIDRSFVEDCATKTEDRQICSAIISLAKNLGIVTIAEGVETEEQKNVLLDLGCDIFQGYLFHRPQPAQKVSALLRKHEAFSTESI